jgi:iron complex outermembrane receptor protein
MKRNLTPIASGVALFLMGAAMSAQAQEADSNVQTVVTTGIRASLQQSLNVKRKAVANIEVVTAEDVGKMPDKNVADSLQRLPGVNISTSAAGSGGFDENDRVSLRGTAPSLTQTLINGHPVSSGDWFALDQGGSAVGRSVSFSLFPSEVIGQVKVYKSSTADLVEGGTAGSVDILTHRPLDFKKSLSIEASAEAVYSTLPGKTEPQFSAMVNWKNDANTFGVMLQGFDEKRSLRRDGQELLSWVQISPTSPVVTGIDPRYPAAGPGTPPPQIKAHPDLANVWMPNLIGSTLFEQTRIRKGGLIDFEIKPVDGLTLDFSYFHSHLNATNYNRNYMFWNGGPGGLFNPGWAGDQRYAVAPISYTVQNGTLTSATFRNTLPISNTNANIPHRDYAIVDEILRPDEAATTQFADFDARWRVNSQLTLSTKIGKTKGVGDTPKQDVYEGQQGGDDANTGFSYTLNGIGSPATASFSGFDPRNFAGTGLNWVWGESIQMTDKENYEQIDGEYALDSGAFSNLKFGIRSTKHERSNFVIAQGPNWANTSPSGSMATNPVWDGSTYPSDFGQQLGGNFPKTVWQLDPATLEAWGDLHSNRSISREYFTDMFGLTEKTAAAYVSTDLSGEGWSANAGVRYVQTKDSTLQYQILPAQPPGGTLAAYPWGGFINPVTIDNNTNAILPSGNLKLDVAKDLVARFSASRTMTRPDFSAIAGAVTVNDATASGNGGNPYLKPITSNNFDASLQWYYAPRALLSAGIYRMDLQNYVGYQNSVQSLLNATQSQKTGSAVYSDYTISSPQGVDAAVTGLEFAASVPLGAGWGVDGNLTLADSAIKFGGCPAFQVATTSSPCDMVGASKVTYNTGVFYENDKFNARVGWAWRSDYLAAYDRGTPLYQAAVGTLSASVNYNITPNFALTFQGQNMNQPILVNYIYNKDQPSRFYSNGAQYYVGARFKY